MSDHAGCADDLRRAVAAAFRRAGETRPVDVTIATAPPLIHTGFEQPGMTCPHGVTFWVEPTGEQRAEWAQEWARDGAA